MYFLANLSRAAFCCVRDDALPEGAHGAPAPPAGGGGGGRRRPRPPARLSDASAAADAMDAPEKGLALSPLQPRPSPPQTVRRTPGASATAAQPSAYSAPILGHYSPTWASLGQKKNARRESKSASARRAPRVRRSRGRPARHSVHGDGPRVLLPATCSHCDTNFFTTCDSPRPHDDGTRFCSGECEASHSADLMDLVAMWRLNCMRPAAAGRPRCDAVVSNSLC